MASENPHLAQPLVWFGAPPQQARVGLVALHGRGQSPEVFKTLVLDRLSLDGVCVVAPAAAGQTWYPRRFMEDGVERDEAVLHARLAVARASRELAAKGVPETSQLITGFSQGACLACEYVFRDRPKVAGLVAFTGGLLGALGSTWVADANAFTGLLVRLGGSLDDEWVPAARMRETGEVFRAASAQVELLFRSGTEHGVSDAQLEHLRELIGAR